MASTVPSRAFRVLVINPNSTESFTDAMRAALGDEHAPPGFDLDFYTAPASAPASIEGTTDSILTAAACLSDLRPRVQEWDGFVVACFSAHPLAHALRELTAAPVMGNLEAPLLLASTLGTRVGILTTSPRWEPLLTHDVASLHLSAQNSAGVVSSGLSVLDLEHLPREQVVATLCEVAVVELQGKRAADVIVLGCAGMVGLDAAIRLACRPGMVVLDPVRCALEMLCAVLRAGGKTSKVGMYAPA